MTFTKKYPMTAKKTLLMWRNERISVTALTGMTDNEMAMIRQEFLGDEDGPTGANWQILNGHVFVDHFSVKREEVDS